MWLMRVATIVKLVGRNGLLLLFALRHAATPRSLKIGILAMLAYLISPIDLVPEFFGFLGLADDAALMMVGIPFLMKRLPEEVRADAQAWLDRLMSKFGMGGSVADPDTPENTVDAETPERRP